VVQRCQGHKRGNVLAYLPKSQQPPWRRTLQAAYEKPTYPAANAALLRIRQALRLVNESAVKSLDEGLEETLTLHRLAVFSTLGGSLKTTNRAPAGSRASERCRCSGKHCALGSRLRRLRGLSRLRNLMTGRPVRQVRLTLTLTALHSRRRSEGRRPWRDSKQRKVMKGAASEFQLRMGLTLCNFPA
jgi:hypothetical protein